MAFSLYAATVPNYIQLLGAMGGLIGKAEAHCKDKGLAPAALIQARLAPDMWPFADQIKSVGAHSRGAIEGVFKGVFMPDPTTAPTTFEGLRATISGALDAVQSVKPAQLDEIADRDMRFEFRDTKLPFTVADFLLSFSQPNFYFHATAAYAILRNQGVAIGKRDYTGRLRIKT